MATIRIMVLFSIFLQLSPPLADEFTLLFGFMHWQVFSFTSFCSCAHLLRIVPLQKHEHVSLFHSLFTGQTSGSLLHIQLHVDLSQTKGCLHGIEAGAIEYLHLHTQRLAIHCWYLLQETFEILHRPTHLM